MDKEDIFIHNGAQHSHKDKFWSGVVAHACTPSTWETSTGGSLGSKIAWARK